MNGKTITEVVLEAARDSNADKLTIDKLETLALPEIQVLTPTQIRALRERSNLSRAVWAKILNIGVTTAQKWEAGTTKPDGAALKLLNVVEHQGVATLLR
jgi:putative transcriptional regulator